MGDGYIDVVKVFERTRRGKVDQLVSCGDSAAGIYIVVLMRIWLFCTQGIPAE